MNYYTWKLCFQGETMQTHTCDLPIFIIFFASFKNKTRKSQYCSSGVNGTLSWCNVFFFFFLSFYIFQNLTPVTTYLQSTSDNGRASHQSTASHVLSPELGQSRAFVCLFPVVLCVCVVNNNKKDNVRKSFLFSKLFLFLNAYKSPSIRNQSNEQKEMKQTYV